MLSCACEIFCQLRFGVDQPALARTPWQVLQVREMFLVFKPCTAQAVLVGHQGHLSKWGVYRHLPLFCCEWRRCFAGVHVCIIYEKGCVLVSQVSDTGMRKIRPLQCLG